MNRIPIYLLAAGCLLTVFIACQRKWDNPYNEAEYNTPPEAKVYVSTSAGSVDTVFFADASSCTDLEDDVSDLEVRWDWESDGTWDTDWSTAKTDSHQYATGGVKAVRMAVKDRGGLTDTAIVVLGVNSPPVAALTVSKKLDNYSLTVFADGSGVTDNEEPAGSLQVRWDFGDGNWTAWRKQKQDTFLVTGTGINDREWRTVRVEVKDGGGLTGTAQEDVLIDYYPGMKHIPADTFQMGSEFENDTVSNPYAGNNMFVKEMPVHPVALSAYWIDSTEVTQADYKSLMHENPSTVLGDNQPVHHVTWYRAVLYCNARSKRDGLDTVYTYTGIDTAAGIGISVPDIILTGVQIQYDVKGYRLPTEAEWEYACKKDTDTEFHFGDNDSLLARYGWTQWLSFEARTQEVAQLLPNQSGLYDMHGNVWEWCNDRYADYSASAVPVQDPHGPDTNPHTGSRIYRGGGFRLNTIYLRSAMRGGQYPGTLNVDDVDVGFRVVLQAQ